MSTKCFMKWGGVLVSTIILASCANHGNGKVASKRTHSNQMASSQGVGGNESFWGDELANANEQELLSRTTFYFDYDSSSLNDNYKRALKAHANYLASNPQAKLRLEGHTDERGSNEYNVALGERRAQTVERFMASQGVNPQQIEIVSYGRQKPAVQGHDESAWKYNRRAIVVYEES